MLQHKYLLSLWNFYRTWFGKLCGATCAICGVLIISLPIPIIVNTFNKLYEKAKIKDQIIKKKKMAGWSSDKQRGSLSKVRNPSQISLQLDSRKITLITSKTFHFTYL